MTAFDKLNKALQLANQIEHLQSELASLMSGETVEVRQTRPAAVQAPPVVNAVTNTPTQNAEVKRKRVMTPEGRERIAAAQRARWEKARAAKSINQ